ncbi:hypothetical protein G6F26_014082 [Rhizopus arrhizus]|nr:hypothetical protein G6F26_014082 [Rhizopus arrhizus]
MAENKKYHFRQILHCEKTKKRTDFVPYCKVTIILCILNTSVASSGNDVSVSVGSSATAASGSSDASPGRKTDAAGPVVPVPDSSDDMDIDVAEALTVAEAAQACKAHQNMGHD